MDGTDRRRNLDLPQSDTILKGLHINVFNGIGNVSLLQILTVRKRICGNLFRIAADTHLLQIVIAPEGIRLNLNNRRRHGITVSSPARKQLIQRISAVLIINSAVITCKFCITTVKMNIRKIIISGKCAIAQLNESDSDIYLS